MNSNFSDETRIKEYLLGTLPEQAWDEIEEKLLSDEEFAEFVDSLEDEIIEEYLTIQNHFLLPPERQRKLLFAKVLRSNLRKEQKTSIEPQRSLRPPRTLRPYWGAMMGAAAVLLLLMAPLTVYTAMLHSELTTAKAKSQDTESALAQVNKLATNLREELALQGKDKDAVNLMAQDRAAGLTHVFSAKRKALEIHIALDEPISPRYQVDLNVTGSRVFGGHASWSQDNVQPTDLDTLVFGIPYYGPGTYIFTVKGSTDRPDSRSKTYSFQAIDKTPDSTSTH